MAVIVAEDPTQTEALLLVKVKLGNGSTVTLTTFKPEHPAVVPVTV